MEMRSGVEIYKGGETEKDGHGEVGRQWWEEIGKWSGGKVM